MPRNKLVVAAAPTFFMDDNDDMVISVFKNNRLINVRLLCYKSQLKFPSISQYYYFFNRTEKI